MTLDALRAALADRYTLERELGAGGMATVFLAHDRKHDRRVAIKVLRPELAAVLGAERFVQEIRTTAALSHPHILPLFDSGEAGGQLYYVMPYVAGETLRDRLDRETQLPIAEAIRITSEVADALDYAHRHGVVHRDIKPENILLHDGRPMVADFGIALAVSAAAGGRMTETGLSLGTPHYMSPEQATADKEITHRSDIYSLGSVLYEMLTGEPPHLGTSAQQIIMKIVTEEAASVTKLRKSVAPNVAAAVATAIEKLPADRFGSAREFADALADPSYRGSSALTGPSGRGDERSSRHLVAALAAATVVATVAAVWGWTRSASSAGEPSAFQVVLGSLINTLRASQAGIALSPDGRTIVYLDSIGPPALPQMPFQTQLFRKTLGNERAEPIAGSIGAIAPSISPDGRWVVFETFDRGLMKLPVSGGSPVPLARVEGTLSSKAWLDDGSIVMSTFGRLLVVPDSGGEPRTIATMDSLARGVFALSPLPASRGALMEGCIGFSDCSTVETMVYDHRSGQVRSLLAGASSPSYLPSGHLAYTRADGALVVVPFDLETLSTGDPSVVVRTSVATDGQLGFAVPSRDGSTLLYLSGSAGLAGAIASNLVVVDRAGRQRTVPGADSLRIVGNGGLGVSADGRRVAFSLAEGSSASNRLFVASLSGGAPTPFTFDGSVNIRPSFSSDGLRILWASDRGGTTTLWSHRADGGGAPVEMPLAEDRPVFDGLWSRDGTWLVYRTDDVAPGAGDILALNLRDSSRVEVAATPAEETSPALSPDGRWIAFSSNRSGRKEVYVRPFPGVEGGLWQVSVEGGTEPLWSPNGKELFYWSASGTLTSAAVTTEPGFNVGGRQALFGGLLARNDDSQYYDVLPDGSGFVMFAIQVDSAAAIGAARGLPVLIRGWDQVVRRAVEAAR